MASPSDNQDQPKKEPGQSSDSNHPPAPETQTRQQSPETGYPPAMGYPPNMGYPHGQPGYPPPYHNYPPNPNVYNNGYPYTQPPPAAYYANNQSYSSSSSGFARGILAGLIFLVIFTCMSSLITWLVLRPEIPEFQVNSLSVSNFNVSNVVFTANWDANMTVVNPNHKLKVYFERIESLINYKENILSTSMVEPFFLDTKAQDIRHVKLKANSTDQPMVGNWVVAEMSQERNTGTVSFNMRMAVWATFKSGTWWTRHATLKVVCDNLKVAFVGATGNGASAPAKINDNECLVFV